jgi:hypothetical protein
MPCSFKILLIVFRPTAYPTYLSAVLATTVIHAKRRRNVTVRPATS